MSWFGETLYTGFRQSHEVVKVLYEGRSRFQRVKVFESARFGRVLALDGIVQTTTADEFVYHEMMSHLPILANGRAESVLIIGGGDGGILEEVLKHRRVKRATMVEIDDLVIKVSKKYLPSICGRAFADRRTNLIVGDGARHVAETDERYDVVIVDSSDPIGPAEVLFDSPFYRNCRRVLRPGGIMVNQNGVPFMQGSEVTSTHARMRRLFAHTDFYVAAVPTYVCGFMTLAWASDRNIAAVPAATIARRFKAARLKGLRYYNPDIHLGAFALPTYVRDLMR